MDDHGWVPISLIASFRRVSYCSLCACMIYVIWFYHGKILLPLVFHDMFYCAIFLDIFK